MIVDERLVTYINSLDTGNTSILDQIEQEALDSYVPIIRKEMQQFLKLLLAMKRPMRILEVGTAVGFSAILMAEYDPVPCEITTIENYEKRIPIAKENFIRAGKEKQIMLSCPIRISRMHDITDWMLRLRQSAARSGAYCPGEPYSRSYTRPGNSFSRFSDGFTLWF